MSDCKNRASIVRQKKKSDALNNAGQREFDVDDERIQLAAAFTQRFHDATRNPLLAAMSRRVQCSFVSPFSRTLVRRCVRLGTIGRNCLRRVSV